MLYRSRSIEILRRAFPGIRIEEAEEVDSVGVLARYPANTTLCHEGTIESTFYVLVDGDVEVTKRINPNESHLLRVLHPGDFFGEMALIHNAPRGASVTTITAALVLEIEKGDFLLLLEKSNIISLTMLREVSRRMAEYDA